MLQEVRRCDVTAPPTRHAIPSFIACLVIPSCRRVDYGRVEAARRPSGRVAGGTRYRTARRISRNHRQPARRWYFSPDKFESLVTGRLLHGPGGPQAEPGRKKRIGPGRPDNWGPCTGPVTSRKLRRLFSSYLSGGQNVVKESDDKKVVKVQMDTFSWKLRTNTGDQANCVCCNSNIENVCLWVSFFLLSAQFVFLRLLSAVTMYFLIQVGMHDEIFHLEIFKNFMKFYIARYKASLDRL